MNVIFKEGENSSLAEIEAYPPKAEGVHDAR